MDKDLSHRGATLKILTTLFWLSLIWTLMVFIVPPVSAAPPTPNVPCEERCTLLGYVTECNACGGAKPHLRIDYLKCCDPCHGCTYPTREYCVSYC